MSTLQKKDLIKAIKELDPSRVEYCIHQGLDPNDLDRNGKPPIYHAILEGSTRNIHSQDFIKVRQTIQILLFYGAKLNKLNKKEKSLLEEFMQGYKPGSYSSLSHSKKSNVKNLKTENMSGQDTKSEFLKQTDSFIQSNLPKEKINSFLEKHLESILLSLLGFILPIYIQSNLGKQLATGDEFWAKSSLIVVLPILTISFFLLYDFWKERKIYKMLLTAPSLISNFVFVAYLFLLPLAGQIQENLNEEYKECFSSNVSNCSSTQKGIYEDFLFSKQGIYLRKDESLLLALAEGIRPETIWKNLGSGDPVIQRSLQEEFTRRGFIYYLSQLEKGNSPDRIFLEREGIFVFYSIAFGEANSDLLDLENIPPDLKSKLNLNPSEEFKLGILDSEKMNTFYKTILLDVKGMSREETQLAVYFLTQFTVELEEFAFETLMEKWISYNPQYEKELRQLIYLRNQARFLFLSESKEDRKIGIKFLEESDFAFYKPFLKTTGIEFNQGEDISFTFQLQIEEETNLRKVVFPEIKSNEVDTPLYVFLSDALKEEVKEQFQSNGEETWIYALPYSLVCKLCK